MTVSRSVDIHFTSGQIMHIDNVENAQIQNGVLIVDACGHRYMINFDSVRYTDALEIKVVH